MKSRSLFILLLLCSAIPVEGNLSDDAGPGGRVITGEMIQRAGVTRIGEILLLVDEWDITSTDGFTWKASANGLAPLQGQTWIIMLDGQKFNLNSFDIKHLDLLPVTLDQVDYVEVISQPQLHAGEFTDRGLIHIHTRKPALGITLAGTLVLGNETGDPGPYRYTEYTTPNIDRIANDGSLTIDFGRKNWYARTGLVVQQHPFTDRAMFKRISETISDYPGLHTGISSSLRLGVKLPHGKHELAAGYSRSSKYFIFFKPLGREFPVNIILPHIGMSGTFSASRNMNITYRLIYSVNQLEKYPNALNFDFDWRAHSLCANIESAFNGSGYRSIVGIGLDRITVETGYQLENASYHLGKIYGGLNYRLSNAMHQNMSTLIAFSNGTAAIKGALVNEWRIGPRHDVRTTLSFSQRLLEEDNSLWYWSERGYNLLRANDVDYSISGNIDESQQFTGDIIWKINLSGNFIIETAGSYRYFTDLYLERQSFQFNPQDCSFSSPVQIRGGRKGHIAGGSIAITHRSARQVRQQFFYSCRTAVAGDNDFTAVWKAVPKHKASYRLTYTPVEDFTIWAMASCRSSSTWDDYQNIDGQSCAISDQVWVPYSSTVKGSTILDLQIQKWFWRRKLLGNLLIRNVWDRPYRYHPIGASFDLSFYIQVKVLLNSQ